MEEDAEALIAPNVAALAAAVAAVNKGFYFSAIGPVAISTYDLSSFVRSLGSSADAPAFRAAIQSAQRGANADITALTALTTAMTVAQGGTNATTAAGARTNLGAAASGANADITSLTGLTAALTVAQGGTGVTTSTGSGAGVHAGSPTITTPDIIGTSTNDTAAVGSVGEMISSTILTASAVALTSGVIANITSIPLTAGEWEVWGTVCMKPAGTTTMSNVGGAINTVSATFPTAPAGGAVVSLPYATPAGQNPQFPVGRVRISLAAPTTVYLLVAATFAVSTNAAFGYLGARRVR
jgi:hypothetical protein